MEVFTKVNSKMGNSMAMANTKPKISHTSDNSFKETSMAKEVLNTKMDNITKEVFS